MVPQNIGEVVQKPILHVEDKLVLRSMMECLLESRGYKIAQFPSCDAALEEATTNFEGYSAMIFDFSTPPGELTGVDLAKRVREAGYVGSIIIHSGNPEWEILTPETKTTFNIQYLPKPCSNKDLLGSLELTN